MVNSFPDLDYTSELPLYKPDEDAEGNIALMLASIFLDRRGQVICHISLGATHFQEYAKL
jgi:hypothetical protein